MTKRKDPKDLQKRGPKNKFRPEMLKQIEKLAEMGHTDFEMAGFFEIAESTFRKWAMENPEILVTLKAGKAVADQRVERSLYQRAVGYNYTAVKIFMPAGRAEPVYAEYTEHVPPDVTAGIYWTKNRMPDRWRDQQQLEHVLGKYIISDRPMSEEEWARERADVLDAKAAELLVDKTKYQPPRAYAHGTVLQAREGCSLDIEAETVL
jgi:hypothetical protein